MTWQTIAAIGLSVYLVTLAVWDWRRRENAWWATTPLVFALAGWRLWHGPAVVVLAGWVLATLPYRVHWYGAADYRLLLVTWGLFPTLGYAFTLGIGMVMLAGLALLLVPRADTRAGAPKPSAEAGNRRPGRAELLRHGRPGVFLISLPALVYLWAVAPLTQTALFG
jgi:hypothetical protein